MNNEIDMTEELGRNFLVYAIDTDQNKAFPSVADGMLPGARAAIWEMYTQKYTSNKPHVKSAKVASGVIGKWWPHNADATYGTLVRMAQPFIENNLEIDFQGAVGNVIGGQQSYGSSRYTEMRLSKLAEEGLLYGVDKNNCDMIMNYTQDAQWPKVLPAVFPRLLVNGSVGLGVGLSQNWTLHNFKETADLITKYINDGELDLDNYYPDYPTGGTIVNKDDLANINKTGRGKIIIEANYKIYPKENKIIFTEFPYQVYIEDLISKIKVAVNNEKIISIDDVYNSSDKNAVSITVIYDKNHSAEYCINELFANTPLRSQYNIIQNGIVNQVPELLNLQQTIDVYVKHNLECIKREHQYDLDEANARIEILNGLSKALIHIDEIILIIKESENSQDAKEKLSSAFGFTENQTKAILEMRLSKLTKLDGVSINKELDEKKKLAEFCNQVVNSQEEQKKILLNRLEELVKKYGTPRRTKVIQKDIVKVSKATQKKEEVIESVVVTYNSLGYLQRIPISMYKNGNLQSFKLTTADFIILFSNLGKFYRISVKDIKSCGVKDKGTAIGSIIKLDNNEKIIGVFSSIIDEKHPYILFAMKNGYVKKTEKFEYIGTTRNLNGMIATKLKDTEVVSVQETNGNDIILETGNNYTIRFSAEEVRESGKASLGVKGITLQNDDEVVKCRVINKGQNPDIIKQKRGGKGKKC